MLHTDVLVTYLATRRSSSAVLLPWDLATRAWRPVVTQRQLSVFVYYTGGVCVGAALELK